MTQQRRIWPPMGAAQPLPTTYRGCRFRSRLEARWAVFFDHMGIGWQYEPQGYLVGGRPYLPDFLLECGSWVEVKGAEQELDRALLLRAAVELPEPPGAVDSTPRLLILGPIPGPLSGPPNDAYELRSHGWLALWPDGRGHEVHHDEVIFSYALWKFRRMDRPYYMDEPRDLAGSWLTPTVQSWGDDEWQDKAYAAARGARFEHGERGR